MSYQDYINQKKDLYSFILNFITNTDEDSNSYQDLINYFKTKNNINTKDELYELLRLLVKIAKNHHRTPNLNMKIEQIIEYFSDKIKQTFSNLEIFFIFKSAKLLVLFLINKKILILDKTIIIQILEKSAKTAKYHHFFSPEIKSFIKTEPIENFESELSQLEQVDDSNYEVFDSNRRKGENNSSICSIIRNDSVEEFISLISSSKISLNRSRIRSSIFETNSIFIQKDPSFIEYAAFFGSIKIFTHLISQKVDLTLLTFICAVHSNDPKFIQVFEESSIKIPIEYYQKCYEESIKCHHNEIAKYIKNKFLNKKACKRVSDKKIDRITLSCAFRFSNYEFLPVVLNNNKLSFYLACQFGYLKVVQILSNSKNIDLNAQIILLFNVLNEI